MPHARMGHTVAWVRESANTWHHAPSFFHRYTNPSFNVLVVQTPRPAFLNSPLLDAFKQTGV